MYVKYNSVYKVWQCVQSTSDESVTPDGQHRTRERCLGCSAATLRPLPGPPHRRRTRPGPSTSAGWSCRSSQRHPAGGAAICPTLTLLTTCCRDSGPPVSHCTQPLYTPCTVQPLYSNTPHTTVSLSATPRPWRRTLRYVQWNIFHTTSEIFLFLFYGTFNPRLWMTWMYLCSDNHHHDIVSIYHLLLKNISSKEKIYLHILQSCNCSVPAPAFCWW